MKSRPIEMRALLIEKSFVPRIMMMRIACAAASIAVFAAFLLLDSVSGYAQSTEIHKPDQPAGIVTITKPHEGDTVIVGHIALVSFTPQSSIGTNISLQFSSDSGTSWNVIAGLNGGTTYNWVVPNTPTDRALVRVIDSGRVAGVSGRFMILAPGTVDTVVILGAPNIAPGAPATIAWKTTGYVGSSVSIDISFDNERSWIPIATDIAVGTSKSYPWTAPDTNVAGAVLRLRFASGSSRHSQPFNIGSLGVSPEGEMSALTVFPNPARSKVYLAYSLASGSAVRIVVADALGRALISDNLGVQGPGRHNATVDLSRIPPGTYYISIVGSSQVYQTEIAVVR